MSIPGPEAQLVPKDARPESTPGTESGTLTTPDADLCLDRTLTDDPVVRRGRWAMDLAGDPSIYAVGVAGLFGASALYHRGNWSPRWHARLQRVDHTMIFVVIAATATPAYLLAARGTFGVVGLIVMWAATFAAVGLRLAWMDAPEALVACALVAVSAVAAMVLPAVWIHAGTAPALLLIVAGVLHAVGAISYQLRRPDPLPAVFGYHEVFHSYVCVATACQYAAIGLFLL